MADSYARLRASVRVQHVKLWERFMLSRKHIIQDIERSGHEVESLEGLLWHGTSDTSPWDICKSNDGLDFRVVRAACLLLVLQCYADASMSRVSVSFCLSFFRHDTAGGMAVVCTLQGEQHIATRPLLLLRAALRVESSSSSLECWLGVPNSLAWSLTTD